MCPGVLRKLRLTTSATDMSSPAHVGPAHRALQVILQHEGNVLDRFNLRRGISESTSHRIMRDTQYVTKQDIFFAFVSFF